jgi:radical SAM protein with 4Fe4S-binding SPASM domain
VTWQTHGLDAVTRGCLGGTSFCFISHQGDVTRDSFGRIWQDSEHFQSLRNFDQLKGKCGICEYKRVCGGCRARAYEATGDWLAEEPLCLYEPAKAGAAGNS